MKINFGDILLIVLTFVKSCLNHYSKPTLPHFHLLNYELRLNQMFELVAKNDSNMK